MTTQKPLTETDYEIVITCRNKLQDMDLDEMPEEDRKNIWNALESLENTILNNL